MTCYKLHDYQEAAVKRLFLEEQLGLLWDMGVGKTLTVLDAIANWPFDLRVLIVAPKRCCTRVWPSEIDNWGFNLPYAIMVGDKRRREKALASDVGIKIVNPENVPWLYEQLKAAKQVPFDMVVIDESTEFKNPTSKRFKAIKQLLPHIPYRVILTGTPTPKNYTDLWAQIYLLDEGKTLGKNITTFRRKYCEQDFFNNWHVRPGCVPEIDKLIAPLVSRGDATELLKMPELRWNRVEIDLPAKVKKAYDAGLAELCDEIEERDGFDSTGNAFIRLRTLCSGFAYETDDLDPEAPRETKWLHREKIKAIGEIHDGIGGKPLLVAFNFRAEREALVEAYGCPYIDGGTSGDRGDELVDQWCRGELPMLAIHPGAVKYGINMQSGGQNLAWLSLPTSLADWQQTNARLYRQGQKSAVTIHSVIANGTIDKRLVGLMEDKEATQEAFLQAMKELVSV